MRDVKLVPKNMREKRTEAARNRRTGEMTERLTGFDYCFTRCMEPRADKQEIRENCSLYKVCLERQIFEKLQHYEDLEEQGRLVELPCAVEDIVYAAEATLKGAEE